MPLEFEKKYDCELIRDKIEELGPTGFNELFQESHINSKGTFNNRIKEMEAKGEVVREHFRPDEGRPRVLIKLSPEASDPKYATLRRLELAAGPYSDLDAEDAREFLTEEVVEMMIEISKYKYKGEPEGFKKIEYSLMNLKNSEEEAPSEQPEKKFDEVVFLSSIERYRVEKNLIGKYKESIEGKLEEEKEVTRYFPALGTIFESSPTSVLEKRELEKQFKELKDWTSPLREREGLAKHYLLEVELRHYLRVSDLLDILIEK